MIVVTSGVARSFVGLYESWSAVRSWLAVTEPPKEGPKLGSEVEWEACGGLMTLQAAITHPLKESKE